jgi:O-antigen ligase
VSASGAGRSALRPTHLLAVAGFAVAAWACAQDWEAAQYVIFALLVAVLALRRLAWGYAALLILFLFEILSAGHGLASPARTSGVVLGILSYPALRWRLRQDGWARGRPSWWTLFLAAFLLYGLASVVVAVDLRVWANTLSRHLLFAGLAFVGYACIQTKRDLWTVCTVVFLGVCGIAVLGLMQYATHITIPGVHTWNYYGAIRTTSTTVRPHSFAFMLVSGLVYGAALVYASGKWWVRPAAAAGCALILAALATTMVRSSLVFGVGPLALAYAPRLRPKGWRRGLALAGAVALLAVASFALPSPIRSRFLAAVSSVDESVFARSNTVRTGFEIALHNPLGVGLGNAEHQYDLYRSADDPGYMLSSHNAYLELAGTVGWGGLALFLLMLWATHTRAKSAERRIAEGGDARTARLLMGLRFVIYAFLGQAFFWHQILGDKLTWGTLGVIHAGAALALLSTAPPRRDETSAALARSA